MKVNKILESKKLKESTNEKSIESFLTKFGFNDERYPHIINSYNNTEANVVSVSFNDGISAKDYRILKKNLKDSGASDIYLAKRHIDSSKGNELWSTVEFEFMNKKNEGYSHFEKDGGPFWYLSKHGLGPGMLPKGVNVVDTIEDDNFNTYIALDKVLSTQALKDYELKEKKPPIKEARRKASDPKQIENYWFEDDGNFFNKEELVEFGEEIVDHLNEIFNSKWELTGAYEDGKEIEIEVTSDDVGTYVHSVKVDFRKIKKPSDINKYIMAFVAKFSEQIRKDTKDMMLNESLGGKYAKKILEFAKRSLDNHYDITGILEIVLRYCPEDILKDAWHDKIRFLIDDTDDSDLLDDNDSKLIESASEDIPTETLAGPEEGPKAGLAELISMAIKDEWDAIETYNTLSITARAEGFEDIATISDEIGTEENKHVGQLQAALKTISPNAEAINVGEEEGNNQLEG